MDTATDGSDPDLSLERWRRCIAVYAASVAIHAWRTGALTKGGTKRVSWLPLAVKEFKQCEANPDAYPRPEGWTAWEARDKDIGQFIQKWYNRFKETGTTLDKERPGRPRTVPDAELESLITHITPCLADCIESLLRVGSAAGSARHTP
jgi:hypothetical protein